MIDSNVFFDTNILVYAVDPGQPVKREIAEALITKASIDDTGRVSSQVVGEWLHVAYHRHRYLTRTGTERMLTDVIWPFHRASPAAETFIDALRLQERYRLSFWDAIVVADARAARCAVMYSEDLQHGQVVDGVLIVNPFLPES